MFRNHIRKKLAKYVRLYFQAHPEIKVVVVDGSVGKTSTRVRLAEVLAQKYRVRMELENDDSDIGVLLLMLGLPYPEDLSSYSEWRGIFKRAEAAVKAPADVDVIIQELDADHTSRISHFNQFIIPDIAVITAVSPIHMDAFKTVEGVAQEEMSAANFSKMAVINRDDVDGEKYGALLTNPNIVTYGNNSEANYSFVAQDFEAGGGYVGYFETPGIGQIAAKVNVVGEHNLRPVIAAVAVGAKMGLSRNEIEAGIARVKPLQGRLNVLRGMNESLVLDDTFDSSPATVTAALKTLYGVAAPARIAVFSDLVELGEMSEAEHKRIGEMCDPNMLSWVVTVGEESEKYLAPAARARGCQVKSFREAVEAGGFVSSVIEKGAVVLFNGAASMFLEEAVKIVLHASEEELQLVRQSERWMEKKQQVLSGVVASDAELDNS